ncbi:MAG: amidohydrolase family protein, partial [Sinomicrobium sp.]|nr:amidohydrolase family protein [Sinomicrobium sp.]
PNGILMAQVAPRGGRVSGTSSIVQLDAWNWEDAALKADDGIHMNWPNSFTRGRWWMGEDPGIKPNKDYSRQIDEAREFMAQAEAYLKSTPAVKNLVFEAVKGLYDGTAKLYVHVDGAKEITDAVNFSKAAGIKRMVVVNGDEAWKVADMLAANAIPVILDRPHRLPENNDDDITQPGMLAKLLTDKGVTVSIGMQGQMERMNSRNLPFYAGTYAAYGLDREKAVQLITGNAAKILGIDDRAGTLETGKDATLFISEGDALDMRTNILSHAFIQGREISLETHHTELWKRYMGKYERE